MFLSQSSQTNTTPPSTIQRIPLNSGALKLPQIQSFQHVPSDSNPTVNQSTRNFTNDSRFAQQTTKENVFSVFIVHANIYVHKSMRTSMFAPLVTYRHNASNQDDSASNSVSLTRRTNSKLPSCNKKKFQYVFVSVSCALSLNSFVSQDTTPRACCYAVISMYCLLLYVLLRTGQRVR